MRLDTNRPTLHGLIVATACAGMFAACATNTASNGIGIDSDAQQVDLAMEMNEQDAQIAEVKEIVAPSTIVLDHQAGAVKLTLLEGEGFNQLQISNNGQPVAAEILRLSEPERLVLDIDGMTVASGEQIPVDGSTLVNQMRTGGHGSSGRVVLDLKESVEYVIDEAEDTMLLTFTGEAGQMPNDRMATLATAVMPEAARSAIEERDTTLAMDTEALNEAQAQNSEAALMEEDAIVAAMNIESEPESLEVEETMEAPEVVAAALPQVNSDPALKTLQIQKAGMNANALIAKMESAGVYSFQQSNPSEYILMLEQASLSEEVETALVSPVGEGSIRSVRAAQVGDDIEVRIATELGEKLDVKAEGNTLIVAALNKQSMPSDRIMAQADLDAVNDDTAAGGEVTEVATETGADDTAGLATDDELAELLGDSTMYKGRLISLDLQDTEIDNALRIIAEVSELNIIASDDVTGKVTLRLMDVPWDQALDVILKTNGLDKVQEGNVVRIAPVEKLRAEREALRQARQAEEELEPLRVQYIRVSYAKAAELQPLVETVITERGTVTFDDRSNQLIVKDINKGLQNVSRLVQKLDLRTPQVLIETQIIEAQRSFVRDLGAELGFTFIRSPETGNATGYNFPNSINIGGSSVDASGDTPVALGPTASFFPANNASAAVSALFGSADGTKSLSTRISAAEAEGRVRVVSRPSVAVTNNSPAVIKSVEKLRVKLPSGGVSVATGQGAASSGGGSVATEVIEIGIVLNVTAQASPDYYVLLDINAKSSTLGPQADSVDEIPPEIERSATSSVLVSSGQTFAMGGIYRITEDSEIQGVPFLKDIPVLGTFFRRTGVSDIDEELIFFITPRIIEGSFDDAAMKAVS